MASVATPDGSATVGVGSTKAGSPTAAGSGSSNPRRSVVSTSATCSEGEESGSSAVSSLARSRSEKAASAAISPGASSALTGTGSAFASAA